MTRLFPLALLLLSFFAHGEAAAAQPPRKATANSSLAIDGGVRFHQERKYGGNRCACEPSNASMEEKQFRDCRY